MGHLVRCQALAKILCERKHAGIWFITRTLGPHLERIKRDGYHLIAVPGNPGDREYAEAIAKTIGEYRLERLVLDLKHGFSTESAKLIAGNGTKVISLDDVSQGRKHFDDLIYPVAHADPSLINGSKAGAQFVILREQILRARLNGTKRAGRPPRVFAFFGGGDEAGIGLKVLTALSRLPVKTTLVKGRSYTHQDELDELLGRPDIKAEILTEPDDFAQRLAGADIALLAFGAVVYESAYLGVPFLTISHNQRNELDARRFCGLGVGRHLGPAWTLGADGVAEHVLQALAHPEILEQWSVAGRKLIDGRGAWRVADLIMEGI